MENIKVSIDGLASSRFINSAKRKVKFFKELIKKDFYADFIIEEDDNNYMIYVRNEINNDEDGFLFFEDFGSIIKYLKISYEGSLYLGIKFEELVDNLRSLNNLRNKIPYRYFKSKWNYYYFEFPLKNFTENERIEMVIKFEQIDSNSKLLKFLKKYYKI